jgi:hypothetical protein
MKSAHIIPSNCTLGWKSVTYPEFFRGGVQKIQLRPEGRKNGDRGAVAP